MKNSNQLPLTAVLLSCGTDIKSNLSIQDDGELFYSKELLRPDGIASNQFLYLCSQREIKEGWVMVENGKTPIIGKIVEDFGNTIEVELGWSTTQTKVKIDCSKIEFTTDLKLMTGLYPIPAIPEKALIKKYNSFSEEMDNVEVELLEEFVKRYTQKDNQKRICEQDVLMVIPDKVDVEKLINSSEARKTFQGTACFAQERLAFDIGFREGYNQALQSNAGGFSLEDIVRFTIKQWSSLNEQREKDHQDLVNNFINNDLKQFIQSLTPKPQGEIEMYLIDGDIHFKS